MQCDVNYLLTDENLYPLSFMLNPCIHSQFRFYNKCIYSSNALMCPIACVDVPAI